MRKLVDQNNFLIPTKGTYYSFILTRALRRINPLFISHFHGNAPEDFGYGVVNGCPDCIRLRVSPTPIVSVDRYTTLFGKNILKL